MAEGAGKRLLIVIPYRDRPSHLARVLPHLALYFARDKADSALSVQVIVVEQEPGLPFNRGLMSNIGYLLGAKGADYVCFHDVDFMPIWADYSPVDRPTRIIWYGVEQTVLDPERRFGITHDYQDFFGGVTLCPKAQFEAINGYSGLYWGWGAEDCDFRDRLRRAGIAWGFRDGTFERIAHDHQGLNPRGQPVGRTAYNMALLARRQGAFDDEGLSTCRYKVIRRQLWNDPKNPRAAFQASVVTVAVPPVGLEGAERATQPPK
jgi:hypothetical protein